ncbi:polysaccharide deacetylase [Bacillus sp. BRMEA1]|uniref:polysaccharide deacetylase family protein n=1 Tax=Neobacillus endophyticus TaxID=2738405 RepID=UPI001565B8AF|nr:polysaccharide deacetylase family protein [Neobacillus endophyticus]NRD76451.1 polysaccharide deacetylase [Neobacillus endophyticus]
MGKVKRGWSKVTFIFVGVIVCVVAGIFVTNYIREKASGESANHPKVAYAEGPESHLQAGETTINNKHIPLEKGMAQNQQQNSMVWKNNNGMQNGVENTSATGGQPANQVLANQTLAQQPANSNDKVVYLTFDDGPESFSGDIIALLEKHHFKATFFMLDPNLRKYPESAKLMVQNGEGVGLHGVTHDVHKFYASPNSVIGEMSQDQKTLQEITGVQTFLIRTPYGSVPYLTPEDRKAVDDHGFLMWDWNIDSKDWYYKDGRYVTNVIQQLSKMSHHNGPIVILMHEQKQTLAHLPELLDYLTKQGYESRAIDSTIAPVHFSYHK